MMARVYPLLLIATMVGIGMTTNTFLRAAYEFASTSNKSDCWICLQTPAHADQALPLTAIPFDDPQMNCLHRLFAPVGFGVLVWGGPGGSPPPLPSALNISSSDSRWGGCFRSWYFPVYNLALTRVPTLRVTPQPMNKPKECWCRLQNGHTSTFFVGHSYCESNWYPGTTVTITGKDTKLGVPWTLNGTYWVCRRRAYPWLPTSWYGCCFPAFVVPYIHALDYLREHPAYSGPRAKRAITEAERFWMIAFPTYGTARLAREVIIMTNVLQQISDEMDMSLQRTTYALEQTAAEMAAVRMMVLQNRMALDYLLAADGGTCAVVGKECCTFIPDESNNITDLAKHIRDSITKIKRARDQLLQHDTSGGTWWPFGSLGGWWATIVHWATALVLVVIVFGLYVMLCLSADKSYAYTPLNDLKSFLFFPVFSSLISLF